ncbi:hypothetical protein [Microbacterium sp. B19]|uniref:hypothetical protein n=1 Tax=Microbacterium sp. B19 TaxID=96765 RepID=UPI0003B380F4|nr:hypothetical protein [Microbacterium sp. B19]
MSENVRPTKRALTDLGRSFPPLDVELHRVDDALIQKAQALPAEVAAGGAERVRSLSDRVWFKIKTNDLRGAAGQVDTPAEFSSESSAGLPSAAWWIVAAGHRQSDTKNRDFYARLEAESRRAAKGVPASVNSTHLVPTREDYRRWELEQIALVVIAMQSKVREVIARAAQTGKVWRASIGTFEIGALVKQVDNESYLAVTADGFWDAKALAVLLDAVPGVSAEDWQIEPSEVMGITPASGQVIYSTIIPADSLAAILNEVNDIFL